MAHESSLGADGNPCQPQRVLTACGAARRGAANYEDEVREGSDVVAYVPAMPRVSGW